MQAIFKAAARSDRLSLASRQSLDELVDGFTVLICATGFLEVCTMRSKLWFVVDHDADERV